MSARETRISRRLLVASGAAFGVGPVELDGEQADLCGEKGAVLFALGDARVRDVLEGLGHGCSLGFGGLPKP